MTMNWLSYGGGVNSTALAVLLCEGKLPHYEPFRLIFSDTGDERDETYSYVRSVFEPYLARHSRTLETVRPKETVLQRWQRLRVTGSRIIRSCTEKAKIIPLRDYLRLHAQPGDRQLIGIADDESHRARPGLPTDEWPKLYPLVEEGIDRDGCIQIIRGAGLCVPIKSGCWHCPFLRVGEVKALATERPDRFQTITDLEAAATVAHPPAPGADRTQWGKRRAVVWLKLATDAKAYDDSQDRLFESEPDIPCACWDGEPANAGT